MRSIARKQSLLRQTIVRLEKCTCRTRRRWIGGQITSVVMALPMDRGLDDNGRRENSRRIARSRDDEWSLVGNSPTPRSRMFRIAALDAGRSPWALGVKTIPRVAAGKHTGG